MSYETNTSLINPQWIYLSKTNQESFGSIPGVNFRENYSFGRTIQEMPTLTTLTSIKCLEEPMQNEDTSLYSESMSFKKHHENIVKTNITKSLTFNQLPNNFGKKMAFGKEQRAMTPMSDTIKLSNGFVMNPISREKKLLKPKIACEDDMPRLQEPSFKNITDSLNTVMKRLALETPPFRRADFGIENQISKEGAVYLSKEVLQLASIIKEKLLSEKNNLSSSESTNGGDISSPESIAKARPKIQKYRFLASHRRKKLKERQADVMEC
eukprot:TRINITY_DN3859_c0_g3_i1.p1 TRINITY_DN3859_c0_g3~~TRINITY_DN3859_c0_g3_i1.p1  ORF type:complete len:268 (-),score=52.27 TRINITY_DN3859_c0_g3_i1:98-901(-)